MKRLLALAAGIMLAASATPASCVALSKALHACRLGSHCDTEKIERLRAHCIKDGGIPRE